MKKRIISMVMCMLMLFTAISTAACGEEEDPNTMTIDGNTARAMTLTIWGVKGKGTTDEAVALVEEAMSKITEAQFNTAIKLNLFFENEYDKALEAKMDEIQAQLDLEAAEAEAKKLAEKEAKKNNETLATTKAEETEETTVAADETILDEYGLPATLYPDVEETQLDIFLMTDYDMLMKYSEKGVLSSLDEELSSTSKLLKSYIHPTILSAGKVNGRTVAIPNNQSVGEYTYMLLNKKLMDKYYYDADNMKTFNDAYGLIEDIIREKDAVIPYVGITEPVGMNYFTLDGKTKTIVGAMVSSSDTAPAAPLSLFNNYAWTSYMTNMKALDEKNALGGETISVDKPFGVAIIRGNEADVAAFQEDYYINVIQAPTADTTNMYNGMFAVSTYTKSLARSMEIVTYLNTRSDLRNVFGYGVQDVHYTLDKEGVLTVISKDYNMNLAYTGNMFLAHAPAGMPADYWDAAKLQNLDLKAGLYNGFTYNEKTVDTKLLDEVLKVSAQFYKEYEAASLDDMEALIAKYTELVAANEKIMAWINSERPVEEETEEDAKDDKKDEEEAEEEVIEPVSVGILFAEWFAKAYPNAMK